MAEEKIKLSVVGAMYDKEENRVKFFVSELDMKKEDYELTKKRLGIKESEKVAESQNDASEEGEMKAKEVKGL